MADPRFYAVAGPFTLGQLAEIAGAEIAGAGTSEMTFADVAPLSAAGARDVSFLDNRRYLDAFRQSRAGACLISREAAEAAPPGMRLLIAKDPYRAYAKVAAAYYPPCPPEPGVHPTASVATDAQLGEGCRIDAGAVVGARAEIGRRRMGDAGTGIRRGICGGKGG